MVPYCIQYKSDWSVTLLQLILRKHTPYLALTGELWGEFYENFGENWPCHNDTALYMEVIAFDNSCVILTTNKHLSTICGVSVDYVDQYTALKLKYHQLIKF